MDIKESTQLAKEKMPLKLAEVLESSKKQFIRTMQGDIKSLKKGQPARPSLPKVDQVKKAAPPIELPVVEPAGRPVFPSSPSFSLKSAERLRKETEIKKRIEETQKRLEEERMRAEMARQKIEREKVKKTRKEAKEAKSVLLKKKPSFISRLLHLSEPIQPVKPPKSAVAKAPIPPKPVLPPRPIPRPIPSEPIIPLKPALPKKEISKPAIKNSRLKFVFVGLAVILIIGGIGGFFYWWNYLRVIPPVAMHYQCQYFQCVSIEGEGEDQCLADEDCQPVEPTVPEPLIPVDETRTIELTIGQENLLLDDLKLVAVQEPTLNTFKRILVKLVSQTEKRYADLDTLVSVLGISLPDNILSVIAPGEVAAGDYTLFFYNQSEGNRLGLVIEMAESETLVADLKSWETTIVEDLKPLFLEDEVPAAFTEGFQDNLYQDIAIRYLNFPDPGLSVDYGIVAGKLVITTSRESMYAAIDALLVASPTGETVIDCGQVGPDNPDSTGIVKNCVAKRFKECKPTQYTATLDLGPLGGLVTYYYEIIGPKDNLCEVKSKFLANPNPDWVGKEMTCQYDNSKDFEVAVSDFVGKCSGPLYNMMTEGMQLTDNLNCTLSTDLVKIEILKGVRASINASGFKGSEDDISWASQDENIAIVEPADGKTVMVESVEQGSTEIIVIDNAIGPNCNISIPVIVK